MLSWSSGFSRSPLSVSSTANRVRRPERTEVLGAKLPFTLRRGSEKKRTPVIRDPFVGTLIVAAGLLPAACEAKVSVPVPCFTIDGLYYSGGYHCPPGHAEKGHR